jgi:two-component system NtrC family response regulator
MVDKGSFREDLFYRLNVFPVLLPPLRERKGDIPKLTYHFLRHFCRKTGKRIEGFHDNALEILVKHEWPGNVRQLKNVVERLVIMADSDMLNSLDLLDSPQMKQFLKTDEIPDTLEELKAVKKQLLEQNYGQIEKAFLMKALKASHGNISNAAKRVGMQRPNFSALIKRHQISTETTKEEHE